MAEAPPEIRRLIERFKEHREEYLSGAYKEEQVCAEFILPMFEALGWDISNKQGSSEAYKEVIHHDSIRSGVGTEAPDYCFRIGGVRKFFLEAKKPSVNIKDDLHPAYQLRRYAWSAKLPLGILTDFAEFAVYDCRSKPAKTDKASTARILYLTYDRFLDRWDEIAGVFSKDAILKGSFDKYAAAMKGKRGTAGVDDAFLEEIERWRKILAQNVAQRNRKLDVRELNFAVQTIIDRIIFLRICEDQGFESYGQLMALQNGPHAYDRLVEIFRNADRRYNSGLFHFEEEKGRPTPPDTVTPRLKIDDDVLSDIFKNLYYPQSPYEFSVLPTEILGQVYERFLGKIIHLTPTRRAVIEEKPEVRKAGGVYYTPSYIVDYIVKNTVGKLIEGKTPKNASKIRILDPACGSGSFLIGAYQMLLKWHLDWYVNHDPTKWARGKRPALFRDRSGHWSLSIDEQRRILTDNIYGVDIDPQAVEVTKLSLLLKLLESRRQGEMFREHALPDLGANIKCGNSLIGTDYGTSGQAGLFSDEEREMINAFDWKAEFNSIMQGGGFDAVIGNPPYLKIEHMSDFERKYYGASYRTFKKRYDAYGLFVEKSMFLLNRDGRFGMIIPSTMLNNLSFGKLREMLLKMVSIEEIVNLGGKVFPGVNNDTMILLCLNSYKKGSKTRIMDVSKYGEGLSTAQMIGYRDLSKLAISPDYVFELRVTENESVLSAKLEKCSVRLGDICEVFQGFVTGGNDAYIVDADTIHKNALERAICQPAVFGEDVSRYSKPRTKSFVIYLTRESRLEDYPRIRKWLAPFKAILSKKREVKMGRQPWYALHWPRVKANFERPEKLLVQAIRNLSLKKRIVSTLDASRLFADHTINVIYSKQSEYDLRYVLGILNSSLINHLFAKRYTDINIKGAYLSEIPIPRIAFSKRAEKAKYDKMVELVDRILKLNSCTVRDNTPHVAEATQRQIAATDRQIDQLVYELYGLTEEEIKIVEEKA